MGDVTSDVEIDKTSNLVSFYLSGEGVAPGTFAVVDYTKSLTGIYDPNSRRCFLIGGIRNSIADFQTLSSFYEQNATSSVESDDKNLYYKIADDYPVSDKSFIPAPLLTRCASLPVYWLDPSIADQQHRDKRLVDIPITIKIKIGWFTITITFDIPFP